jgi:acetoin utilization deacetylase AcuC-like enzyme
MGFCVFNNAAVAARAVQHAFGYRTLVVDYDYHHGNGTQAVAGDGLSYVSTHAYPAYPGTGSADENFRLREDGVINVPLPPHAFGTEAFLALWESLLPRVVRALRPDMLIVSAGFDYVAGDPVGDLGVDVDAASHLTELIRRVAGESCGGRVCYMLEGGYRIDAIADSVRQVLQTHDGQTINRGTAEFASIPQTQERILRRVQDVLC